MKTHVLLRQLHHWGSFAIALPLIVMIGAGLLLMLKKEIDWIQPPSHKGMERQAVPTQSLEALFAAAKTVKQAGFTSWAELERLDFKPGKGMVKFVSSTRWEVQIDTHTAEILHIAYRRSDLIESLHDGSFFADWVKLYVFLPSGIILFGLWLTGLYLFFLPHYKKRQKRLAKTKFLSR